MSRRVLCVQCEQPIALEGDRVVPVTVFVDESPRRLRINDNTALATFASRLDGNLATFFTERCTGICGVLPLSRRGRCESNAILVVAVVEARDRHLLTSLVFKDGRELHVEGLRRRIFHLEANVDDVILPPGMQYAVAWSTTSAAFIRVQSKLRISSVR